MCTCFCRRVSVISEWYSPIPLFLSFSLHSLSGNVSSDTMNLNIKITSGPNTGKTALGIYEVDFGPVCTFLTWAVSNPGVPSPPPDFMSAMNSTTATVYVFEQPKPQ